LAAAGTAKMETRKATTSHLFIALLLDTRPA
jgi:hypothetical protein